MSIKPVKMAKTILIPFANQSQKKIRVFEEILQEIRKSAKIQEQVDKIIRDLEKQSESAGSVGKIKSKRGGNVEVIVKHRVAWPHEAILGVLQGLECHTTSLLCHNGSRVSARMF